MPSCSSSIADLIDAPKGLLERCAGDEAIGQNVGTYRTMVHDDKTMSVFIELGKHGDIIRRKYWERGHLCVVCVGQAPVLGSLAGSPSEKGVSEPVQVGGRVGEAIRVVHGEVTGLPFQADAELVFEGFMPSPEVESRSEGPFAEWTEYYLRHA